MATYLKRANGLPEHEIRVRRERESRSRKSRVLRENQESEAYLNF